jgi:hypothetical protein
MVLGLLALLLVALLVALLPVEHVGPGHFVLAGAHQGQFHLVLDVLDVEGAAVGLAPDQGGHHVVGQVLHQLADAGAGGGLATVHGDEGLGQGNGDLAGLEGHHGAVAADDLVVGVGRGGGAILRGKPGGGGTGWRRMEYRRRIASVRLLWGGCPASLEHPVVY